MLKWTSHSQHPCPSCIALHGQIHDPAVWTEKSLEPKDHRLYCTHHCTCTLDETDESEKGDLAEVPLRKEYKKMLNPRNTEIRLDAFQSEPTKTPNGYEVLVIRAGTANGWNFSKEVIQNSVKYWNAVDCFLDHNIYGESVRNLAGVFSNPRWSDDHQGIIADLRPAGLAAETLKLYAEEMFSDQDPKPNIGFSPVLIFKANGDDVEEIIRVRSEDVVIDPAFKTKFIATFKKEKPMDNQIPPEAEVHLSAMKQLTGAQKEIDSAVKGAKEMHLQACQNLLASSLDAELELNEDAKKLIRSRFENRTFTPPELVEEIKTFRSAFAKQNQNSVVAGVTQVSGMFSSEDQIQAAIDDLLDAPRNEGSEKLKVHRFSGIREAYLMLTNDFNFVGDVDNRLAQFQSNTATFPALTANALNKSIAKHWKNYGEAGYNWWEKVTTVEPFESLQDIKWLRLGTISALPSVAEGAEYTELKLGDNGEDSTFVKYGGYLAFTLEAMDKDDTRRLRAAPRELALAAIRNISEQIAAIFTSNSGAGPTLNDGGALFNSTATTTAGGHANLLTTALGTDYTAWNAISLAMYNQAMHVANETGYYGTGKKQAIEPRYILVPRALKPSAEALFVPRWEAQAQNVSAVSPTWGGRVEVITVPEWTDVNDYAAVIDPTLVPGVMLGTRYGLMPQVIIAGDQSNPAMFSNDESRLKVRHFLATGIGNWSALHKSNVT